MATTAVMTASVGTTAGVPPMASSRARVVQVRAAARLKKLYGTQSLRNLVGALFGGGYMCETQMVPFAFMTVLRSVHAVERSGLK